MKKTYLSPDFKTITLDRIDTLLADSAGLTDVVNGAGDSSENVENPEFDPSNPYGDGTNF